MTRETTELLRKALTLPVPERADLASSLIESLDGAEDEGVEAAWDREIARRMEEIDSGRVEPIPLEQARRSILPLPNDRLASLPASGVRMLL